MAEITYRKKTVLAEEIAVGDLVTSDYRKRNPERVVDDIKVGRKHVTGYDSDGKDFVYLPKGTKVQVKRPADAKAKPEIEDADLV